MKFLANVMSFTEIICFASALLTAISLILSKYETTLFSAAFSFAYFGLCRISEIAVSNAEAKHIISVNDITFAKNFIKVRIPSSKTDQNIH
jgi:hypothetical protein